MITNLSVSNFQSLRRVELELGTFTVIVGPSSSGKSALMRACRALASNVRGNGVITRGQKHMAISARTDTHLVTLERTERSGTYKLLCDTDLTNVTFTKLAGDVPEQVTAALRIDPVGPSGSVNFANQFDKPYLLDESGANVAFVLGELTNVTRIFEAVRAANRIRANAASTLKTRKNDLTEVKTALVAFQGLGDRLSALERAEELNRQAQTVQANIDALERAQAKVRLAELTYAAAERLPDVPDGAPMHAAYARLHELASALATESKLRDEAQRAVLAARRKTEVVEAFQHLLDKTLKEAKVCPTCGQSTI